MANQTQRASIIISAKDQVTKALNKVQKSLGKTEKEAEKTDKAFGGLSSAMDKAKGPALAFAAAVGAVAVVAKKAIKDYAEYEAAVGRLSDSHTKAGGTTESFRSTLTRLQRDALAGKGEMTALMDVMNRFNNVTGDSESAMQLYQVALDASARAGLELEAVSKAVAETHTKGLGPLEALNLLTQQQVKDLKAIKDPSEQAAAAIQLIADESRGASDDLAGMQEQMASWGEASDYILREQVKSWKEFLGILFKGALGVEMTAKNAIRIWQEMQFAIASIIHEVDKLLEKVINVGSALTDIRSISDLLEFDASNVAQVYTAGAAPKIEQYVTIEDVAPTTDTTNIQVNESAARAARATVPSRRSGSSAGRTSSSGGSDDSAAKAAAAAEELKHREAIASLLLQEKEFEAALYDLELKRGELGEKEFELQSKKIIEAEKERQEKEEALKLAEKQLKISEQQAKKDKEKAEKDKESKKNFAEAVDYMNFAYDAFNELASAAGVSQGKLMIANSIATGAMALAAAVGIPALGIAPQPEAAASMAASSAKFAVSAAAYGIAGGGGGGGGASGAGSAGSGASSTPTPQVDLTELAARNTGVDNAGRGANIVYDFRGAYGVGPRAAREFGEQVNRATELNQRRVL